jgi:hypothetical protein
MRHWVVPTDATGRAASCEEASLSSYTLDLLNELVARRHDDRSSLDAAETPFLLPINTLEDVTFETASADTAIAAVRELHRFMCPGGDKGPGADTAPIPACPAHPDSWNRKTAENVLEGLQAILDSEIRDFRHAGYHGLDSSSDLDAAGDFESGLFGAFQNVASPVLEKLQARFQALKAAQDRTDSGKSSGSDAVEAENSDRESRGGDNTEVENGSNEDSLETDQRSFIDIIGENALALAFDIILVIAFGLAATLLVRWLRNRRRGQDETPHPVKRASTSSGYSPYVAPAQLPSERAAREQEAPAPPLDPAAEQEIEDRLRDLVAELYRAQARDAEALLEQAEALGKTDDTDAEPDPGMHSTNPSRAAAGASDVSAIPDALKRFLLKLKANDMEQTKVLGELRQEIAALRREVESLRAERAAQSGADQDTETFSENAPWDAPPRKAAKHSATPPAEPPPPQQDAAAPAQWAHTDAPPAADVQSAAGRTAAGATAHRRANGNGTGVPAAFKGMLEAFATGSQLDISASRRSHIQDLLKTAIQDHDGEPHAVWRQFAHGLVKTHLEEDRSPAFYTQLAEVLEKKSDGHIRLIVPKERELFDGARMRSIDSGMSGGGRVDQVRSVQRPGVEVAGDVLLAARVRLG